MSRPMEQTGGMRWSAVSAASKFRRASHLTAVQAKSEQRFVEELKPDCTSEDIAKLLNVMQSATGMDDPALLQSVYIALARVCVSENIFLAFFDLNGLEILRKVMYQKPHIEEGDEALDAIARQAVEWLMTIDPVDFVKLPHVLILARALGDKSEDAALAAMDALNRYCAHRLENRAKIVQGGGLRTLHMILAAHRAPETVHETLEVLYHVCDIPPEMYTEQLIEEKILITSVAETLTHAPVNIRIQLAGMRLLSHWAQSGDREVSRAVRGSGGDKRLKKVVHDLSHGGFDHVAAWMFAVAGQSLVAKKSSRKFRPKP